MAKPCKCTFQALNYDFIGARQFQWICKRVLRLKQQQQQQAKLWERQAKVFCTHSSCFWCLWLIWGQTPFLTKHSWVKLSLQIPWFHLPLRLKCTCLLIMKPHNFTNHVNLGYDPAHYRSCSHFKELTICIKEEFEFDKSKLFALHQQLLIQNVYCSVSYIIYTALHIGYCKYHPG